LGSVLIDNSALNVALENLTKNDFFSDSHRLMFETMVIISERNRTIDLVTLSEELGKEGLLEIETDGAFDPHFHEALLTQPSDSAESGAVLEVVQRGYRVGDRVVRPAKVIVAE